MKTKDKAINIIQLLIAGCTGALVGIMTAAYVLQVLKL